MTNTDVLSVQQVAKELNLSRRAVIHRIDAGTLAATKLGDSRTHGWVVARTEVERVKAERAGQAAAS
jgi:excisionase family DNA binding protein